MWKTSVYYNTFLFIYPQMAQETEETEGIDEVNLQCETFLT